MKKLNELKRQYNELFIMNKLDDLKCRYNELFIMNKLDDLKCRYNELFDVRTEYYGKIKEIQKEMDEIIGSIKELDDTVIDRVTLSSGFDIEEEL